MLRLLTCQPTPKEEEIVAEENEAQSKPESNADQQKAEQKADTTGNESQSAPGAEPAAVREKPAVPKPPPAKKPPPKPKGPMPEPWTDVLVEAVKKNFPDQVVDSYKFVSQRQLVIKKNQLVQIMQFLRQNDFEPFDFMSDETATHWPQDDEFELIYMLYSFKSNDRLRVKVRIKEWEQIDSLVEVWSGANWLEREIYDMFGIQFANHPNLKRILLPEDWVGFPLRKDYDLRLQDVEWVRKHLGIESGQKFYVGKAKHDDE